MARPKLAFLRLKSLLVFAMMSLAMVMAVGCESADVDDDNTIKSGTGVTVSGSGSEYVSSAGGEVVLSFNTSASYTLTVDDPQMLTIKSGASGSAGQNRATLLVSANNTSEERWGEVTISVSGYSSQATVNIIQAYKVDVDSRDEVLKWVDERLLKEYYWLDIYGAAVKAGKVNYTLSTNYQSQGYSNPYSEFLNRTLLSLDGNEEDGSCDEDGNHTRIYTNISRRSTSSSSTRAGAATQGYGLVVQTVLWMKTNPNVYAFPIEHVYPNSPAFHAGLKRGDMIYEVDGQALGDSNYKNAWYAVNGASSNALSVGYEVEVDGQTQIKTISLSAGTYYPTPIACAKVLDIPAEMNPSGKKIGYISYLSFDNEYDNELISTMTSFASEGVEDLILDLRLNGGGVVNTSIMLASMILPESYVDGVYAYLRRHKQNPYGDETCLIIKNNPSTNQDLPNLNLSRVWIISTESTASASEMVIQGLRGLDVEVNLIGLRSEGKNCGMDVMERQFGSYIYTYAPITFMNYNAKEFNDYADGIVPDTDFDEWLSKPILDENGQIKTDEQGRKMYKSNFDDLHLQKMIDNFPIAQSDWGYVVNDGVHPFDVAVHEAVMQINGTTALVPRAEQESSTRAKAEQGYVRQHQKKEHKLRREGGGSLFYGLQERVQAEQQAEQQTEQQTLPEGEQ